MKLLKLSLLIIFVFSIGMAINDEWKYSKGIYYYVIKDVSKGQEKDLVFEFPKSDKNFSTVAIGKGSGNFDVDIALYDDDGNAISSDTSADIIAIATYPYPNNAKTANIKVACTSGKGIVVLYAGETIKLLRVLTLSSL